MNITEFLEARIAEDEKWAQQEDARLCRHNPPAHDALYALASVYRLHPDYDPSWTTNAR